MKKMVTLFLSVLMFSAMPINLYANDFAVQENPAVLAEISPRFQNITSASSLLSISNSGVAAVSANLRALGCEKTKIICNLQQQQSGGWTTLKTFSAEDNLSVLAMSGSWAVTKGYNYRIEVTFYAYRNGVSESTTQYYYAYY